MQARPKQSRVYAPYVVLCIYVIAVMFWRVLIPGGEYVMPPWHIVSMLFTVAILIALFVMRQQVREELRSDPSRAATATLLFWGAMTAGVITLLIRWTSDAAWWTGHLRDGL